MLQISEKAPDFTLKDEKGQSVTLSSFKGKKVVVYFYPKDNTPGCTTQACAFKAVYDMFREKGVAVLGISRDGAESHTKFIEKYNLPFTLLSDPDASVIQAFGAWKKKTMFGKTSFGTARATFVIDENGIIEKVFEKANPETNAADILEYLNG